MLFSIELTAASIGLPLMNASPVKMSFNSVSVPIISVMLKPVAALLK